MNKTERPLMAEYALMSVILVSLLFIISHHPDRVAFPHRDIRCIGYLLDGTLYGGQPECVQPPAAYAMGAALSFFGDVQAMTYLALIGLNALCLFLILVMVRPGDRVLAAAIALSYCFLILPSTRGQPETALGLAFCLGAAYLIFIRDDTVKGASLLALSLASKVTALSAISGIFLALIMRSLGPMIKWRKGSVRIKKGAAAKGARSVAFFFAPILFVVLIAWIVWPDIFVYCLLSHSHTEKLGYVGAVTGIAMTDPLAQPDLLMFYVILAGSLLYYRKTGDGFGLVYAAASLTTFISRYKPAEVIPDIFVTHYTIFPLPFLLIIGARAMVGLPRQRMRKLAAFCVVFFLFAGDYSLEDGPNMKKWIAQSFGGYQKLAEESAKLEALIDGFWGQLPATEGQVLVNDQIYELYERSPGKIGEDQLVNRNNPPENYKYLDTAFVPGLKEHGVLKKESFDLYPEELELADEIASGRFSYILVGPKAWDSQIEYAYGAVTEDELPGYCMIGLPYYSPYQNERHLGTARLDSPKACLDALKGIFEYGNRIFDSVCEMDEWAANVLVRGMVAQNQWAGPNGNPRQLVIQRVCSSGADLTGELLSAEGSSHLKLPIFLFGIVAFIIIYRGWL